MNKEIGGVEKLREMIIKYINEYHDTPFVIVNKNTYEDIKGEMSLLLFDAATTAFGCPIAVCEVLDDDVVVLR